MSNKIVELFTESITEQGIKDIIAKHDPKIVRDMSNDVEFKEARKVRSEMNKVLENIDRIGINSAKQITDMRNDFKDRVESAYSPTVKPFLLEDKKRKDEKKRLEDEKKARIKEQEQKIADIKGASNRAMYLPVDDIEDILQGVCGVNLSWFDKEFYGEAQITKEVAISQLTDSLKHKAEKEEDRKKSEIKDAELADKNDEIEELKRQLSLHASKAPEPKKEVEEFKTTQIYNMHEDFHNFCKAHNLNDDAIVELSVLLQKHSNF